MVVRTCTACVQATETLHLDNVLRNLGSIDSDAWREWNRAAASCATLSSALALAGFIAEDSEVPGSSWKLPKGCAIVIFSWGPYAQWITREAGKQARRLLAAGTNLPPRSYHAAFHGIAAATSSAFSTSQLCGPTAISSASWHSGDSRFLAIRACVDRTGLLLSDYECQKAADLMGQFHMPDNAADMVLERFIQPLVASVEFAGSRQRKFSILRTKAPFSGVAEYVQGLSEAALLHMGVAYWVELFLESQCSGKPPPRSLDGLRVGGEAKQVGKVSGRCKVSAVSNAGVDTDASRTSPDLLVALVASLLGPCPAGYFTLYHGTTLSCLEDVMTNPSCDRNRSHKRDFGKALYATMCPRQALAWAKSREQATDPAAVVVWQIPHALTGSLRVYKFGLDAASIASFNRTVLSFRQLEGADLADFAETWEDTDVIVGPVARPTRDWAHVMLDDVCLLDLSRSGDAGGPHYGDQHALRTPKATRVLRHADTRVCGVVLLSDGQVVRVPVLAAE